MLTVWKYGLNTAVTDAEIPVAHRFLYVAVQDAEPSVSGGVIHPTPTLWVEVDPDSPKAPWRFVTVGTGHEVPEGWSYVGSYQLLAGRFVGHVYGTEAP